MYALCTALFALFKLCSVTETQTLIYILFWLYHPFSATTCDLKVEFGGGFSAISVASGDRRSAVVIRGGSAGRCATFFQVSAPSPILVTFYSAKTEKARKKVHRRHTCAGPLAATGHPPKPTQNTRPVHMRWYPDAQSRATTRWPKMATTNSAFCWAPMGTVCSPPDLTGFG